MRRYAWSLILGGLGCAALLTPAPLLGGIILFAALTTVIDAYFDTPDHRAARRRNGR